MHGALAILCVMALAMGWHVAGSDPTVVGAGFFVMLCWLGLPALGLGTLAFTASVASGDRAWIALTFVPAIAVVVTLFWESIGVWSTITGAYVATVAWRLGVAAVQRLTRK